MKLATIANASRVYPLCIALFAIAAVVSLSGCISVMGMYANLMHAAGVDRIPPEYEGLEECSLAIITVTDSSHYSDDASARILSRQVGDILRRELDELRLVREDKIEEWRDMNGWDSTDFVAIGKGIKAEKVIGIELTNLKLREGATLYRGRSDATVTVVDVATSEVLYRRSLDEYTYPINAGQYTNDTTESRFRKLYLGMLAKQIARSFHRWDFNEDFANDSIIASQ